MGLEGWELIGDVNQFVECSEYGSNYALTYPQIKTVLVFKQQVISAISTLPEDGGALPVGALFGKEIDALNGETKRILCTDFVSQKYIANRGYDYDTDASVKYKTLLGSRLSPLGKYKVARGTVQKLTNFDELLLKNIPPDQILCIITGTMLGSQTAFLKNQDLSHIGIGVVIDIE